MTTRRVVVCLDVKGGRVVKGVQFEGLRDVGDPVELATRAEADAVDVPVIASGGAGTAQHLVDAFVEGQAEAALVAGMVHDGSTTVGALKRALRAAGLEVRGGLS